MLLYDKKIDTKSERAKQVIEDFKSLIKESDLRLNNSGDEHNNYDYIASQIKKKIVDKYYDDRYVCDILVKHYFYDKKSVRKKMFLDCFSDVINENIRKNIDDCIVFCKDCGKEIDIKRTNKKTIRCEECQRIADNKVKQAYKRRIIKKSSKPA